MKMLGVAVAADAAIWTGLYFHDSGINDPIDTAEIALIGGVFGLLALVMVIGTPHWSARAAGLLQTSIGTATIFLSSLWIRLHQKFIEIPYNGTTVRIPIRRINEGWIDLGRASFAVGGVLLLYGIVIWIHANWGPRSESQVPLRGIGERRSGRDRRRSATDDIVIEHRSHAA